MIDIEVIESWDKGGRETLVREKKTRIKFEVRRKGRKKREREIKWTGVGSKMYF